MRILLLAVILVHPMSSFAQTISAASNTAVQIRPVNAVLSNDVEARRAKPGSAVKAKAYSGFTTAEGTRIPPGATILGQITEATTLGKGSIESRLGVLFHQVQLSTGQLVPIHMGIAGLAAPPPVESPDLQPNMSADMSSFPGMQQSGGRVDPRNSTSGMPSNRTTRGIVGTRRPAGPAEDASGSPMDIAPQGEHTAAVARVGSTVPGIALKGSTESGVVLVSTSGNITLRSGTPLVLTILADPPSR